ncbi:hypothetical protein OH807_36725 [Kitasatospora sp. NBC_01560]
MPADGSGAPSVLLADADSPAPIGPARDTAAPDAPTATGPTATGPAQP